MLKKSGYTIQQINLKYIPTIFPLSFSVLTIVSLLPGVVKLFIAFSKLKITYIIQKKMVNRQHIAAYRKRISFHLPQGYLGAKVTRMQENQESSNRRT